MPGRQREARRERYRSRTDIGRAAIRDVHFAAERLRRSPQHPGFRDEVESVIRGVLARYGNARRVDIRVQLGDTCGEATIGFYDRRGDEILSAGHLANALGL